MGIDHVASRGNGNDAYFLISLTGDPFISRPLLTHHVMRPRIWLDIVSLPFLSYLTCSSSSSFPSSSSHPTLAIDFCTLSVDDERSWCWSRNYDFMSWTCFYQWTEPAKIVYALENKQIITNIQSFVFFGDLQWRRDIFHPRGDKKGTRLGTRRYLWMSRASLSFELPHAGAAQVLEVFLRPADASDWCIYVREELFGAHRQIRQVFSSISGIKVTGAVIVKCPLRSS